MMKIDDFFIPIIYLVALIIMMLKSSTFGMILTLLFARQLNFLSVFMTKPNANIKDHFHFSALDYIRKKNKYTVSFFLTLCAIYLLRYIKSESDYKKITT